MPFIKAKVRMDDKITITVFTGPMMGISYESEPIIDRLQQEYAERIKSGM